jgi:hypothetical protein
LWAHVSLEPWTTSNRAKTLRERAPLFAQQPPVVCGSVLDSIKVRSYIGNLAHSSYEQARNGKLFPNQPVGRRGRPSFRINPRRACGLLPPATISTSNTNGRRERPDELE